MSRTMKTINLSRTSRFDTLHIEAPGCIINIMHKLTDGDGRQVVSVEIRCDQYAGEPLVHLPDLEAPDAADPTRYATIRVVREQAAAPKEFRLVTRFRTTEERDHAVQVANSIGGMSGEEAEDDEERKALFVVDAFDENGAQRFLKHILDAEPTLVYHYTITETAAA